MEELEKAIFESFNRDTNKAVEDDLLRDPAARPYIPREGEYWIASDENMYKVTRIVWNHKKREVRVQGEVVVLAYVLNRQKSPIFQGTIQEVLRWIKTGKNERLVDAVYVDAPYNYAYDRERFFVLFEED